MVEGPWIVRMGNQVSNNLKSSILSQHHSVSSKRKDSASTNNSAHKKKQTIEILSFEVANLMSKVVHLHKSLSDQDLCKLKNEIITSEGAKLLVSSDEFYLLELACAEKLDDLSRVGENVARLGKKCSEPALLGFEHVFGDLLSGEINVKELGFLVKDMESTIKKMERYVAATSNLYSELEILNELEQAAKKYLQNQLEESLRAIEQKLTWQKQDVKRLKDASLWNQSYDKIVELLARTVCTIYGRICLAFGNGNAAFRTNTVKSTISVSLKSFGGGVDPALEECIKGDRKIAFLQQKNRFPSPMARKLFRKSANAKLQHGDPNSVQEPNFSLPCCPGPGRIMMECLSMSSMACRVEDDADSDCEEQSSVSVICSVDHKQPANPTNGSIFGSKSRLGVHATPSTVGGSALALHYANVIVIVEKFLRYPHLVGEEARDDLYQMLPASLRNSLDKNMKLYFKNLAIFDAAVAQKWREELDGVLKWLAPLAHNMIRWQSERNFEQQQIIKRTNVLLLQTLYFADREKTEAAICQLLMGLNYVCRYEHQQNALLDCASSFDYHDWMEWHLQCQASCLD